MFDISILKQIIIYYIFVALFPYKKLMWLFYNNPVYWKDGDYPHFPKNEETGHVRLLLNIFGEGHWKATTLVGLRAGPRQSEAPHSSPVLECTFCSPCPQLESVQRYKLERAMCYWDPLDGPLVRTQGLYINSQVAGGCVMRSTSLVAAKISLIGKFPCLWNHHLPMCSGLPLLQSIFAFHEGGLISDFTLGTLEVANQQDHVMGWWQSFRSFKQTVSHGLSCVWDPLAS